MNARPKPLADEAQPRVYRCRHRSLYFEMEDRFALRVCSSASLVEQLEEFDGFAIAMAILDQGVNFAGQEINPGENAHGFAPDIFV
jgi:hypothetical protein